MIKIEKLSKHYGQKQVLFDINLHFQKGQTYGIVGENGAGKTTLFRCIAGLENHEGVIISDLTPLKNYLGLLMTEPYFFSKITGREYIQLLTTARHQTIANMDTQNIFDLPLDQYASTYSTGMKKKLALTAILLQGNEIFILDEPFNGVDIQSNLMITEIIHRLKQLNKTVLIASHIFSTLSATCDVIYLLQAGRITKQVMHPDFDQLEAAMKAFTIGNRVDQLNLK